MNLVFTVQLSWDWPCVVATGLGGVAGKCAQFGVAIQDQTSLWDIMGHKESKTSHYRI